MNLFQNIKFDRNEFSGAFGDIGTDLPLIIGIILTTRIDAASALIMFGLMQIFTGMRYGIPLSVQPLKAFAAIIITQKISGNIMFAGGLMIGIIMLVLSLTGIIKRLAEWTPKCVIRGIQFGLGIKLSVLALKNYIGAEAIPGYAIAAIAFIVGVFLLGNRKYPPAVFIIALGMLSAIIFKKFDLSFISAASIEFPKSQLTFSLGDFISAFFLLTLPQIPLSIGNSILATSRIAKDYFPEKDVSVKKISYTYSLMNIVSPFFGGIPSCHGSGGIAGHYAFGARTAGSVIIYGSLFLMIGLFFSHNFQNVMNLFPLPILGVMLLFESITLLSLIKDTTSQTFEFFIAVAVGLAAANLPYGFAVSLPLGLMLYYSRHLMPKLIKNIE